ncbi:glycoside hydrolase [uncultured Acetobacteroides sp.]|uniref:glycoside hydrolase n=1 Tax=uncultured Acetobacteroides sp. TaxID=1760811 RepID=UPI0029F58628|nr:glycoside hydrolase [uncultured Acetobacteroides sp.]
MKFQSFFLVALTALTTNCKADKSDPNGSEYQPGQAVVTIDVSKTYQTMDNFGASDCWTAQFIGKNWPVEKRNAMADLLFSTAMDANGQPKGIGLSSWRFNIGAGSAEQGSTSNIETVWRRSECFLNADGTYDWNKQEGQRWFLRAAKTRGVETFIGFTNSPPVYMTENGIANNKGRTSVSYNLKSGKIGEYTDFLVNVVKGIKQTDGVDINYISPFNEPEWKWDGSSQEGSPALDSDIALVVKNLDQKLTEANLNSKILVCESGQYDLTYKADNNYPGRSNHIFNFFNSTSPSYIGNLSHVPNLIGAHGYFTTTPESKLVSTRESMGAALKNQNLGFWQTEFCMLETDPLAGSGPGKDLTMTFALYVARIMHFDITTANASAWQWWLGITNGDYKDGLVYASDNTSDGTFTDSKLLWAMGNFSRFVRPGAVRVSVASSTYKTNDPTGLMLSGFIDNNRKELIVVAVNYSTVDKTFSPIVKGATISSYVPYTTSDATGDNLKPGSALSSTSAFKVPARSVVTFVGKIK